MLNLACSEHKYILLRMLYCYEIYKFDFSWLIKYYTVKPD